MLSEDVRLKFRDFEPTQEMRSMVDILLNELHRKSPSSSFMAATFTLTNGIFGGVIKVTSTAGNFAVNAADATIGGLRRQLFDNLLAQLKEWRKIRFD